MSFLQAPQSMPWGPLKQYVTEESNTQVAPNNGAVIVMWTGMVKIIVIVYIASAVILNPSDNNDNCDTYIGQNNKMLNALYIHEWNNK